MGLCSEPLVASEMMYATALGESQCVWLRRCGKHRTTVLRRWVITLPSRSNKRPLGIVKMKCTAPFMEQSQIGK